MDTRQGSWDDENSIEGTVVVALYRKESGRSYLRRAPLGNIVTSAFPASLLVLISAIHATKSPDSRLISGSSR